MTIARKLGYAVTEFKDGHLGAAETVEGDALGVDRFDADSSRQKVVDHPPGPCRACSLHAT